MSEKLKNDVIEDVRVLCPDCADGCASLRSDSPIEKTCDCGRFRLQESMDALEKHEDQVNDEVAKLVELFTKQDREEEYLDEEVHEAKASEASDINNNGVEDQIRYLLSVDSFENVKRMIEDRND